MTEPSSNAINRLADLIAVSREATDQQLAALATTVEQTTRNVDRAVEAIQRSADRIEHQVGRMSEHLTAIDIKIEQLTDQIDRLAQTIADQGRVASENATTARIQSENVAQLSRLVEQLLISTERR
jgi:methyl-accepting chemotaxis protein